MEETEGRVRGGGAGHQQGQSCIAEAVPPSQKLSPPLPLQVQLPHWPVLEGFEAKWETYLTRLQSEREALAALAVAMRRVSVRQRG